MRRRDLSGHRPLRRQSAWPLGLGGGGGLHRLEERQLRIQRRHEGPVLPRAPLDPQHLPQAASVAHDVAGEAEGDAESVDPHRVGEAHPQRASEGPGHVEQAEQHRGGRAHAEHDPCEDGVHGDQDALHASGRPTVAVVVLRRRKVAVGLEEVAGAQGRKGEGARGKELPILLQRVEDLQVRLRLLRLWDDNLLNHPGHRGRLSQRRRRHGLLRQRLPFRRGRRRQALRG
mmetsp:Transcript_58758/g.164878  ORF Transcript_58758/g.164878 Transcript_58758/m.164878 type:complete len:230 (-) Transcript_58758:405-1094(-)